MLLLLRRRRRRRRPKVFEANALESLSLFLSFHSLAAAFTLLTLASFDSSSRSDTLCQSSDCAYTHSGNQDQATTPKTKQKWRLRQPRHLPAERLLWGVFHLKEREGGNSSSAVVVDSIYFLGFIFLLFRLLFGTDCGRQEGKKGSRMWQRKNKTKDKHDTSTICHSGGGGTPSLNTQRDQEKQLLDTNRIEMEPPRKNKKHEGEFFCLKWRG